MIARWLVLCVLVIGLVACTKSGVSVTHSVTRHVDDEAGVVCWVYASIEQGGISCLPITDTKLGK